jgi:RNase P protein component
MKKFMFTIWLIFIFCIQLYAQNSACPIISLSVSPKRAIVGESVTFTANVNGESLAKIEYKWTVLDGKIEKGEGSSIIVVSPINDYVSEIKATIEIIGLSESCQNIVSETVEYMLCILHAPLNLKTDGFSINPSQIDKSRLDNFFVELDNDPTSLIIIIERFESAVSRNQVKLKLRKLFLYLKAKNVQSERIIVFLNKEDKTLTEFWVSPAGADVLECKNCLQVSSGDIEWAVNKLFPKKNLKKSKAE